MRAERAAAEQRRALLLREMNHRIKNVLAAVQAIANQTFKDRATPDSMRTFGSRLAAMAAAHDLLVTENWESADLHQTVDRRARTLRLDRRRRFAIDGPPAQITARAALRCRWRCTSSAPTRRNTARSAARPARSRYAGASPPAEAGPRFRFTWTESGGPPVAAPERRGFGTRLIETALASELSASARARVPRVRRLTFTLDADATQVLSGDRPASLEGTAA